MYIIKPKYYKKGGSIKSFLKNPYLQSIVLGAASGAAKTYLGKRKYDDLINTVGKIKKIVGKGIIYE